MLGFGGEEAQALTDRLGTGETLSIVILIVVLTISGALQDEFLFRGYVFHARCATGKVYGRRLSRPASSSPRHKPAAAARAAARDSGFWNTKVFEYLEKTGWQYSIGVR
jgi:hypothetical protein